MQEKMCGRFAQYSSLPELKKLIDIDSVNCDIVPYYNIAPTHSILSIINRGENRLGKLNWGLVPFWSKDLSLASSLINARAETLSEKPSFRQAFKKRRCLIPADGFYEWKQDAGNKQPWYIRPESSGPFVFAGLWETWRGPEAEYHSCTIITMAAGASIRNIHHRMPVILKPEFHQAWLDTDNQETEALNRILAQGHEQEFDSYLVSRRVNSPTMDDPACIEPLSEP